MSGGCVPSQPYQLDRLVLASDTQQATLHHTTSPLLSLLKMPLQSTPSGRSSGSTKAINTQSDGKSFEQRKQECLQRGVLFEDPDFPAVDSSLFYSQSVPIQFEWKRPKVCRSRFVFLGGGFGR